MHVGNARNHRTDLCFVGDDVHVIDIMEEKLLSYFGKLTTVQNGVRS